MKSQAQDMRNNKLQEPSIHSIELSNMLGVGIRTARAAQCLHGIVSAGDVAVLRDSSIVICKAPIHKEGEQQVRLVAQRTERCRTAIFTAPLALT